MIIIWTKEAEYDFEQNIRYLTENWSEAVVYDFINATERTIELIGNNPKLFKHYLTTKVRCVPIVSQITLFYKTTLNNEVVLLRFWNNYQSIDKLKI